MELKSKVAIVTGGGQGIGETIAMTLAQQGAHVVIADINLETANEVAGKIKDSKCKSIAIQVDVTDSEQVNNMVDRVIKELGTVDILVNNAGYVAPMMRPLIKETEEYWDKVIAICLKGVILCSRAVTSPR